MATSSNPHPSFPSRPFNTTIAHPDRAKPNVFGSTAAANLQPRDHLQTRDHHARQERDRERLERERVEREGQEWVGQLSEEQKEEIAEAVSAR